MEAVYLVRGKRLGVRITALSPRHYRARTGRDLIVDMTALREAWDGAKSGQELPPEMLAVFACVVHSLAKDADPALPDTAGEWLDGLRGALRAREVLPGLLALWTLANRTTAKPKAKQRPTTREPSGAIFMLRCAQLGLSDAALGEMDMGMVYDLLIEQGNDHEKYPYRATQEDFDSF